MFAAGVVLNDVRFTNLLPLLIRELVGLALGEGSASLGSFYIYPWGGLDTPRIVVGNY